MKRTEPKLTKASSEMKLLHLPLSVWLWWSENHSICAWTRSCSSSVRRTTLRLETVTCQEMSLTVRPCFRKQIDGQRHQLIVVGDRKYFQERRYRPDLSVPLEFQGRPACVRSSISPEFSSTMSVGCSLDLAIAQRCFDVGSISRSNE